MAQCRTQAPQSGLDLEIEDHNKSVIKEEDNQKNAGIV